MALCGCNHRFVTVSSDKKAVTILELEYRGPKVLFDDQKN